MTKLKTVTVPDFLLNVPLYIRCFPEEGLKGLRALFIEHIVADGHCPYCSRETTFSRTSEGLSALGFDKAIVPRWTNIEKTYNSAGMKLIPKIEEPAFSSLLSLSCARDAQHSIYFHIRLSAFSLQKVGQYPSFADIAIDESRKYKTVLSNEDAAEFHKAIGLASHGVGIGSFVYLRRIFERLIKQRFDDFKAVEGWDEDAFMQLRMAEKIAHLKGHLPDFLVRNKSIYGILSRGVHELSEEECLKFFDVLKESTTLILKEDQHKKVELAARATLEKALQELQNPSGEKS